MAKESMAIPKGDRSILTWITSSVENQLENFQFKYLFKRTRFYHPCYPTCNVFEVENYLHDRLPCGVQIVHL